MDNLAVFIDGRGLFVALDDHRAAVDNARREGFAEGSRAYLVEPDTAEKGDDQASA